MGFFDNNYYLEAGNKEFLPNLFTARFENRFSGNFILRKVITMNELKMCFACGEENPIGFKLKFEKDKDSDRLVADFTPEVTHQGYGEMMHGGLVTTLMDEAMAKVINTRGIKAVTATLDVKFRQPVPIGEPLKIYSELEDEKKRRCRLKAWVENDKGKTMAEAKSVFIKL